MGSIFTHSGLENYRLGSLAENPAVYGNWLATVTVLNPDNKHWCSMVVGQKRTYPTPAVQTTQKVRIVLWPRPTTEVRFEVALKKAWINCHPQYFIIRKQAECT